MLSDWYVVDRVMNFKFPLYHSFSLNILIKVISDQECWICGINSIQGHPALSMSFGWNLAADIFGGTIWRRDIKAFVYVKQCQQTWFLIKLIEDEKEEFFICLIQLHWVQQSEICSLLLKNVHVRAATGPSPTPVKDSAVVNTGGCSPVCA